MIAGKFKHDKKWEKVCHSSNNSIIVSYSETDEIAFQYASPKKIKLSYEIYKEEEKFPTESDEGKETRL